MKAYDRILPPPSSFRPSYCRFFDPDWFLQMTPKENTLNKKDGEREFVADTDLLIDLLRQTLSNGKTFRFSAKGRSMEPFIRSGDIISITPLSPQKPRVGDILAFVYPLDGRLLVHRMILIRGNHYLMKGDASTNQPDGWVKPETLLGRVNRVERGNRKVMIGLGVEKALIALLSRENYLVPLFDRLRSIKLFFEKSLAIK